MENTDLTHTGVKGMKWGERRYQTKNGMWTPLGLKMRRERERSNSNSESDKKKASENAKKKLTKIFMKKKKTVNKHEVKQETEEEKKLREEKEKAEKEKQMAKEQAERQRRHDEAIRSVDPVELFKNKDVLSTAEINERLNRIDTERKLADVAAKATAKPTFSDRVDKVVKAGKKMNEVYELLQKPLYKEIMAKVGLTKPKPAYRAKDWTTIYNNRQNMTNEEMKEAGSRAENEAKIRKAYEDEERRRRAANGGTP